MSPELSPSSSPLLHNPGKYRGFSTSISYLFHHPQDCCSFVWCGIFQSDYNFYLFHKKRRSAFGIMFSYIFVPVMLLFSIALCENFIDNQDLKVIIVFLLILTLIIYFSFHCTRGLVGRIKFRQALSNRVVENLEEPVLPQGFCDAACANLLFYLRDDIDDPQPFIEHNFCTRLWQCFECFCCGSMCKCWFQLFGTCAIAQEGREIRSLVGNEKSQVDYITFESYKSYYPRLLKLRKYRNTSIFWHIGTLSKLSKALLKLLLFSVVGFFVLALVEMIDDAFPFDFQDMGVLVLTFSQAFIILYFVHWKWNRFDLSFDAVVKYFASGFLLCTYIAFFFEIVVGSVLKMIFYTLAYLFYGVKMSFEEGEENYFAKYHPGFSILYYFFNAFLVAALIEELSKYFGYLMVQHPDSIIGYNIDDDLITSNQSVSNSGSLIDRPTNDSNDALVTLEQTEKSRSERIDNVTEKRLNISMGAGITVAMVAVAMGFACCENLIYIFFYTKGSTSSEIQVLLARSIFPIHPLCAAIQSISVCKRLLEKDTKCNLGHIILVPVLIHGLFDFTLMAISVIAESRGYDDELVINLSFFTPVSLTMLGFIYYFTMSDLQLTRLYELDKVILAQQTPPSNEMLSDIV